MSQAGSEPTILVFERVKKVRALDRAATETGVFYRKFYKLNIFHRFMEEEFKSTVMCFLLFQFSCTFISFCNVCLILGSE